MTSRVTLRDGLKKFIRQSNPSFIQNLHADPQEEEKKPNKTSREVYSGHYVRVRPSPLSNPCLVDFSPEFAQTLGLDNDDCLSISFAQFFGGKFDAFDGLKESWATPYALSIYGDQMYHNCPWGTGNGYGDGRAISVAEVLIDGENRWELQLKGAGTTPFSRNADGRAVLRSSVREFLACIFMYSAGVSTTRALSLVTSETEKVMRPWYSNKHRANIEMPDMSSMPESFRNMLKAQFLSRFKDPDIMQPEPCAITCRSAPSFIRVGHIELFSRRISGARAYPKETEDFKIAKEELDMIVKHAIEREFPHIDTSKWRAENRTDAIIQFLENASNRIARLTADWIRVGYVQGNFNSDNCLVGGRTMDYGPFGFIEKFETHWNMWIGGGEKFGFLNQPEAGAKNFETLVDAVMPLFANDSKAILAAQEVKQNHSFKAHLALRDVWQSKLGLNSWPKNADDSILRPLIRLMIQEPTDYTIFWRQLSFVVDEQSLSPKSRVSYEVVAKRLGKAFWSDIFEDRGSEIGKSWHLWVLTWLELLVNENKFDQANLRVAAQQMRLVSPKYVPREWMLVEAYQQAHQQGDKARFDLVKELRDLFQSPYDEHSELESKYYRKSPLETFSGIGVGGITHMS